LLDRVFAAQNHTIQSCGSGGNRGWTKDLIDRTVKNPYTTREAFNRASGNKATAFFRKDGAYVVRDNVTSEIVQVSKIGNSGWIPDATIINPYIP
jgi:hypothetical protein